MRFLRVVIAVGCVAASLGARADQGAAGDAVAASVLDDRAVKVAIAQDAPLQVTEAVVDQDVRVARLEAGALESIGIDPAKLDKKAYVVADKASTYGTGFILLRAGADIAPIGKELLPKGFPIEKVSAALRSNPRATALIVGATAAGYTFTTIEEVAIKESWLARNKYWLTLSVFLLIAGATWLVLAARKAPKTRKTRARPGG